MVWQDGQGLIGDYSRSRLFTVTENLVAQKLLPPIVHVMISPGQSPDGRAMRSIEYDTVSDRYPRFLMEEVLPEVEKTYKLRPDGYSRAIGGESSGGICAFNVAWLMPDKFSRVHSAVGSFTSIQWHPQDKAGGRQRLSLQGAQRAEAQHPHLDERRRRRPGEQSRILADAEHPDGEFAEAAWSTISTSASAPRPTAARRPPSICRNRWRGCGATTIRENHAGIPHRAGRKKRSLFSA